MYATATMYTESPALLLQYESLQIFTQSDPFQGVHKYSIPLRVLRGSRPNRPNSGVGKEISDELWELIERCWSGDPSARPEAAIIESRLSGLDSANNV